MVYRVIVSPHAAWRVPCACLARAWRVHAWCTTVHEQRRGGGDRRQQRERRHRGGHVGGGWRPAVGGSALGTPSWRRGPSAWELVTGSAPRPLVASIPCDKQLTTQTQTYFRRRR